MSGTNDDEKNKNNQPGAGGTSDDPNSGGNPGGDPNGDPNQSPNQNPGGDDGNNGGDDFDYSDPEKVKKELKKLRRENASKRVAARDASEKLKVTEEQLTKIKQTLGLEEEESPEDKIQSLTAQLEALQMENQLTSLAGELGIPPKQNKYFKFLVHERLNDLEEGEELTDEDLQEIAEEAKMVGGSRKSSTGVDSGGGKGGGQKPAGGDQMTVEQFCKMSLTEKSALYQKNPQEYERLFSSAREKGLV